MRGLALGWSWDFWRYLLLALHVCVDDVFMGLGGGGFYAFFGIRILRALFGQYYPKWRGIGGYRGRYSALSNLVHRLDDPPSPS